MTQEEIRRLLGGYATNALSADERRSLFEAALDDQELFNALQNEDALKELLADPVAREQVRRALETPPPRRMEFRWRRWALGVAVPAVAAVAVIIVMNRPRAPGLRAEQARIASADRALVAPPVAERTPAAKKQQFASNRAPAPALQAPIPVESAREAAQTRDAFAYAPLAAPAAAAKASLYQAPSVRYSLIRSGQNGDAVRVEVIAGMAGSVTLYRVDAAGNLKRVYPVNENDAAAQVLPNVATQIPTDPVKVESGEKLRLVVTPAPSATATTGAIGGVVGGLAAGAPIVIDIPVDVK